MWIETSGSIWGLVLRNHLTATGFTLSRFDQRVYLYRTGNSVIIILIVVDDMAISPNDRTLLNEFKTQLASLFNA